MFTQQQVRRCDECCCVTAVVVLVDIELVSAMQEQLLRQACSKHSVGTAIRAPAVLPAAAAAATAAANTRTCGRLVVHHCHCLDLLVLVLGQDVLQQRLVSTLAPWPAGNEKKTTAKATAAAALVPLNTSSRSASSAPSPHSLQDTI
jgi:hypothetical protein